MVCVCESAPARSSVKLLLASAGLGMSGWVGHSGVLFEKMSHSLVFTERSDVGTAPTETHSGIGRMLLENGEPSPDQESSGATELVMICKFSIMHGVENISTTCGAVCVAHILSACLP